MDQIKPDEENIHYLNNYLENVIVRIDFVKKIDSLANALSSKVQKKVMKYFPIPAPGKTFFQEMKFSPTETKTKSEDGIDWKFFGENRDKALSVTSSWMFVELSKYESFNNLKKEFNDCYKGLLTEYPDIQINRIGLRYINNIKFPDGDPFNWEPFINNNLLSSLKFFDESKSLARLFHVSVINFEDSSLKFQFGLLNPDFPASIKQRNFILDYDAAYIGLLDNSDVLAKLDLFHNKIEEYFEKSITDELRKKLNE